MARRIARPPRSLLCTSAGVESVLIANPPAMRVIDLHRPAALNALNAEMVSTLLPLFHDWQQPGGEVKLIVQRGTGPRAFCAGGDIRFLHERAAAYQATNDPEELHGAHDFFREEYSLNHVIGTSRVPVVSLINGIVMGGGVGLSVHGDLRVASETTIFAMPECGIGFFPDVGSTYFLPRLRGSLGLYLGLTGRRLKGRDVLAAGIATHYVPSDRIEALEAILLEFAQRTTGKAYTLQSNQDFVDVETLSAAISGLDRLDGHLPSEEEAEGASRAFLDAVTLAEIDECFGGPDLDSVTRAVNYLAAQHVVGGSGGTHWAVSAARELATASPTSLAVTFEALRRGKEYASLAECLAMEYCIAQRFLKHPDFVSGVGAVLSKGVEPAVWAPPPASVDDFFVAAEGGELMLIE